MRNTIKSQGLPLLCLLAAWGLTLLFYAHYGAYTLTAEESADMVLAAQLNEEGTLLSANWLYGSELRVISPLPVYQLGLRLFSTWHGARVFSIAVLMLGVTLSLLYVLRGAGAGDIALYAATLVVLPVSMQAAKLVSYGGFETVHLMMNCLLLGLVLRLGHRRGRRHRLLCLALLGFAGGVDGWVMGSTCMLPLFALCTVRLVRWLLSRLRRPKADCGSACTLFGGAVLCLAMMAVGSLVRERMLDAYDLVQPAVLQPFSFLDVLKQLNAVIALLGMRAGVQLMSVAGIGCLCALLLAFALPAVPLCLYALRARLSAEEKTLVLFSSCACVTGLLLNVYGGNENADAVAGILPGLLLLLACTFLLLNRMPCRMPGLQKLCCTALCAVFLLNAESNLRANFHSTPTAWHEAAQWLIQNGYKTGYASWDNAHVLTEASDGALEIIVYESFAEKTPANRLQKASHRRVLPEGRVFVYVCAEEWNDAPCALAQHEVWRVSDGAIYAFDNAQEVQELQQTQGERAQSDE